MYRRSQNDPGDREKIIKRLEEIVSELEKGFNPKEILLFGSFARGEAGVQSSLDILVVAETDLPFIDRIKRVIELVSENAIPVEPLVYTPDELREKLEEGDSFIVSAMNEGVLLFSRGEDLSVEEQLEKKAKESEFKDLMLEVD